MFLLERLPSILVPPVVFTGLLLALWTYKCLMTVIFQDKIIYMPYMPPFTRSEKLKDYATCCEPVEWEEKRVTCLDGTRISLGIGEIFPDDAKEKAKVLDENSAVKNVVICYFHGNGGSIPPRLPLLSNTLKLIHSLQPLSIPIRYTLVALSYRGYWTSSGRATESGIKLDTQAMIQYLYTVHPNATLILWGQSIGAGIACYTAAKHIAVSSIAGIVLETPFTSIKAMLLALYPQRWLPYQYLYPFLWNHWDSEKALQHIGKADRRPQVLLLPATRDEIVPTEESVKIQRICEEAGLDTKRIDVIGSLHNEATTRREGQEAVAKFVLDVVNKL